MSYHVTLSVRFVERTVIRFGIDEVNEDDYANNVKLSSPNGVQKTLSKKRKEALRMKSSYISSSGRSGAAAMAPPDMKIFSTINQKEKMQEQGMYQSCTPG
jgi:hypothetical protein